MNVRKIVEEKILYILLTFDKEVLPNDTSLSTFEILHKHSLIWSDFSEKIHQDVFKSIQNQIHKGYTKIDLANLMQFRPADYRVFEKQAEEFLSIVFNLKNTAYAPFSELESLIYKLKEFVLADMWKMIGQTCMSANFQNMNVVEFGETTMARYNELYTRLTSGSSQVNNNSQQMKERLQRKMELAAKGIIGGIPIHVKSIHNAMMGFNEPDLIVIGARPSMGKSVTALSLARGSYNAGYPGAFFSLEMSKQQLYNMIIASETGIDASRMRFGQINRNEFQIVTEMYKKIENSDFIILDNEYKHMEKMIAKIRELHRKGKIKWVVIDYLQLMLHNIPTANRDAYIGEITKTLKSLCLELNIPIILLSQLKRDSAGKQPTLQDLRESGNIEQDADVVAFIHRPTFYQENYDALPYDTQWLTEYIIRKNRSGAVTSVKYFIDILKSMVRDV